MDNVKEWLDKKGYYNSGLRIDRIHRIDLYLSDVLEEYRADLLNISQQREPCEGKCGMSYCDNNGCVDRKRISVEPKDNPDPNKMR